MSSHHVPARRTGFWVVTLAACLAMLATAALGMWQLSRAAQKQQIAASMQARGAQPPLAGAALQAVFPAEHSPEADGLLYRRVALQGRWLEPYTVYLDNRQMDGRQGFFVLTPLQLGADAGARVVLVQRGWAPRNFQDRAALPAIATAPGEVTVLGHIAAPPSQTFALGSGHAEPGFLRIRQNLDLDAFRVETGLPIAALTVVQEGEASEGLLRHWPPIATGVEKHYGYAFQWFALCGLISGLYVWFQLVRPYRRRRG